jgi:NAD(P)H dehydrogenase (quinone)
MIAVTGANGHLGRLVVESLLRKVPASKIVAVVRNPDKARDFASKGVAVRAGDYSKPETLAPAFDAVDVLLLISGNEVGKRVAQHTAVAKAAKQAGARLLAYTSLLHADRSPLLLGEEHRQSEAAIRASGVPFVFLRNSWYNENYGAAIAKAVQFGVHYGCAGEGRISAAARADYAEACAAILTAKEHPGGRTYELAGDEGFTLARFAAEVAQQSGKPVRYENLSEADYKAVLVKAGLPEAAAGFFANTDTGISNGALYDDSRQLSMLIGGPTTPISATIKAALASANRMA